MQIKLVLYENVEMQGDIIILHFSEIHSGLFDMLHVTNEWM